MTQALQAAVASASQLPPEEQDALAALLVAEMESEQRWNELFANSQTTLAQLAQQALVEHEAGLSEPLVPLE
jgi:methylase of polypeptide subunit release factors